MTRLAIALSCLWALPTPLCAEPASFRHDVMAVLAKGGCNMGACHGNLNGKGGLLLSLRGENPDADFATLTRDMLGRRIDVHAPEQSLILRKAAGQAPHEGGVRFRPDSLEYRLLHDWIASGAPNDPPSLPRLVGLDVSPTEEILVEPRDSLRLSVTGHFDDGRSRDLTSLAVYEPTQPGTAEVSPDGEVRLPRAGEAVVLVRYLDRQVPVRLAFVPARPDFVWESPGELGPIDRHVFARLEAMRIRPSEPAGDGEFLRRVYLDTLGILPTPEEARAFLDDPSPSKRAALIDSLLQRPEFADFWALKWSDLLRNEEKVLDAKGVRVLHRWLREGFAAGRPLNELARELLSATGSTYQNPPANFYRALRDPYTRAEAVAQVFLGVRIGCARCHNHPFDRWTRAEYHRFAAVFAQVDYQILANDRKDSNDKHEFDGEQVVFLDRARQLPDPTTGGPLRPALLGVAEPPGGDRLGALADWVADPDNPFFARTQANRIWYHLTGRGLVEPEDDFRATNPATNPPLLDFLTDELVNSGFDPRHVARLILNSRTYQLSWVPNETNAEDETLFSRSLPRPLQAEQLLDAVSRVLDVPVDYDGYPKGTRAGQMAAPKFPSRGAPRGPGETFLKAFGQPDRLLSCDCERSSDAGLMQAFQLITGELLHDMLRRPDNAIGRALGSGISDAELVRRFYLAALGREPEPTEERALADYIAGAKHRRRAAEDVVWGLINAKEFLLRR